MALPALRRTFGPLALTTTLTTDLYHPADNIEDTILQLHIVNKSGSTAKASLWMGASGGNAAGTEILNGRAVLAHQSIDAYVHMVMDADDYLVGGADTSSALSIYAIGERRHSLAVGGAPILGIYGSAFAGDSKNNRRDDDADIAYRFRAISSTTVDGIVWQIRRGPPAGYSGGTCGTVRVSIQTDDGTGKPDGVNLAFTDVGGAADHGGAAGGYVIWTAFGSPPSITAGQLYHVVFHNTDASPLVNYVSVNNLWTSGSAVTPRQRAFDDADLAVLYKVSGTWSEQTKDTPDVDVWCADGTHPGSAYLQAKIDQWGVIAGPNSKVRERFTVTGGDKIVTAVWARINQQSGSGNLVLRLEDSAGTLIESISVATTGVPAWTLGGDPSAGKWFGGNFASNHTLTNGQEYRLVLSTDNSTAYAMVPLLYRDASDDGTHYMHSRRFTDGTGEKTTDGVNWSTLYGSFPQNTQTYFETTT